MSDTESVLSSAKVYMSHDFYFENIGRALDIYNTYEEILIAGDLNAKEEEYILSVFLDLYDLEQLVKARTSK